MRYRIIIDVLAPDGTKQKDLEYVLNSAFEEAQSRAEVVNCSVTAARLVKPVDPTEGISLLRWK
jgi:hypothetical protein